MKAIKIVAIASLVYIGIVVLFESSIGFLQPAGESTLRITTFDDDGTAHDRVLSRLESNGQLYVAANHWPRAWYKRALKNPEVQVTLDGDKSGFRAVPVLENQSEHSRVAADNGLPWFFRVLTGFPPRTFVRLDSR